VASVTGIVTWDLPPASFPELVTTGITSPFVITPSKPNSNRNELVKTIEFVAEAKNWKTAAGAAVPTLIRGIFVLNNARPFCDILKISFFCNTSPTESLGNVDARNSVKPASSVAGIANTVTRTFALPLVRHGKRE
jgi:hypothetical protein